MKITLVTPYYFPVLGGYTLITHNLSKAFREKGHDVKILTPTCEPSYRDGNVLTFDEHSMSYKEKVKIMKGMNFFEKLFGYKELTSIQRDMVLEIEKIRPDVVHTFGAIQFGFVGSMSSARNFLWVHTIITQPTQKISFGKKLMARKIFGRANIITVTAANQIGDVKINYGLNAGTTVKVGVDTDFFNTSSELQREPNIGAVSNFVWKEKVKGLLLLIRSFKRVLSIHPDAKLEIVGEGEYRKLVEETIKEQGLEEKVLLLGRMNRKELRTFYQTITVFAHISYQDTLPLTLLEAMASGLPIVASRIGETPRIVTKDVGFITDFNEENIKAAISRLLDSKELRANLGKGARKKAENEFSWPRVAEEYLAVYRDILPQMQ